VYTNEVIPGIESNLHCGSVTFHRSPKIVSAFECCTKRGENLHSRFVCFLKAIKYMNQDGSFNQIEMIRNAIQDFGMQHGPEIIVSSLECLTKQGPFNVASVKNLDIEKHMTCFQDAFAKSCGTHTAFTVNSDNFEESSFKCGKKVFHVPQDKLEFFQHCHQQTNTTYMRLVCAFRAADVINENFECNPVAIKSWFSGIYGKKSQVILDNILPYLSQLDNKNIWKSANEENSISVLWKIVGALKQGLFDSCGYPSNDFVNTL